jgi:hypothetical protein
MTTARTRQEEIAEIEEFQLTMLKDGVPVAPSMNGLSPYPHKNKMRDTATVSDFKTRFRRAYPGYDCEVQKGDGSPAHPNTLLSTVRASYDNSE